MVCAVQEMIAESAVRDVVIQVTERVSTVHVHVNERGERV